MPLTFKDRVKHAVSSGGTGTLTLGSAPSGYQAFASGDDVKLFPYVIEDGTAWETGYGTYTHSGTTFARTTRTDSSTGSALNVTTSAYVYVDLIAGLLSAVDAAQRSFIRGLELGYSGSTTITCGAGACFIESLGIVVNVASAPSNLTSVSITSGWHYVYGYLSSGTFTLESSTTAPVAFASPAGNARSKSGDTSRRYLGQYLGDGSKVIEFYMYDCGGGLARTDYPAAGLSSPYYVLNTVSDTSFTLKDLSGILPPAVCIEMLATVGVYFTTTGGGLGFALSLDGTNLNIRPYLYVPSPSSPSDVVLWATILPTTPSIYYELQPGGGTSGPVGDMWIHSYKFRR